MGLRQCRTLWSCHSSKSTALTVKTHSAHLKESLASAYMILHTVIGFLTPRTCINFCSVWWSFWNSGAAPVVEDSRDGLNALTAESMPLAWSWWLFEPDGWWSNLPWSSCRRVSCWRISCWRVSCCGSSCSGLSPGWIASTNFDMRTSRPDWVVWAGGPVCSALPLGFGLPTLEELSGGQPLESSSELPAFNSKIRLCRTWEGEHSLSSIVSVWTRDLLSLGNGLKALREKVQLLITWNIVLAMLFEALLAGWRILDERNFSSTIKLASTMHAKPSPAKHLMCLVDNAGMIMEEPPEGVIHAIIKQWTHYVSNIGARGRIIKDQRGQSD